MQRILHTPTGYPTIFIGSYAGVTTVGSDLPEQVTELMSVPSVLETNALELDTSNFNVAYDLWFTESASPLPSDQYSPGEGGAYLMVWLFDPAERQPRGSLVYTARTVADVGEWDVWIDSTDPPCITYVSRTPRSSMDFDLIHFIDDSVNGGFGVTSSMYLSIVFAGFEIWGGGNGLSLDRYCVHVERIHSILS
jgi:hypothetical protein